MYASRCPKISISYLIAVRNKVSTIGKCLDSVLCQDPDEVVVVDGRSDDGTSSIVDTYPVIHLYDEGKGLAAARNLGLKSCKGDFIVIVDADQWIPPGFDRKLRAILCYQSYDLLFLEEVWSGSTIWATAHQEAWKHSSAIRFNRLYRPRVLKRSVVLAVSGWNEEFSSFEDADLWNRVKHLSLRVGRGDLTIYSEASNLTVVSQFGRGVWYGSKLRRFLKLYPYDWEHLTCLAPIGFVIGLLLAAKVTVSTRSFKVALACLVLRFASSLGWFIGVLKNE